MFAVDLNPNYIGYSIVDWKSSSKYKVIHSGVLSNKQLNDEETSLEVSSNNPKKIKLSNKRKFENIESAKWLVNLSKHYRCEIFGIEKLSIDSGDREKGRKLNRLINNQWCRGVLYEQLKKRYVRKYKPVEKNIVFPSSSSIKDKIIQSLEELNVFIEEQDLVSIYRKLKTLKCKIRVPLLEMTTVFSRSSIKSKFKIIITNT